ncbi:MAG: acyl-CoA thioesterase [Anaerolineae bacterium]|nr:acyl-CoA thioesterase [Anaerolineae bacterium]
MERLKKRIAESRFTLSALMGPQNANSMGNVHGGVIMKMVDEAGALVAMRHANLPVVTVAIDSMTFNEPITTRNLVLCNAELTYVGRTSLEVYVEVVAEDPLTGDSRVTNRAYCVYVALNPDGKPATVPEIAFETDAERARAAQAAERQQRRKALAAGH